MVDDGSTDNTAAIVAQGYPSVRLLRQPNGGVSSARNAGVQIATGEYIVFVDADDTLAPHALDRLLPLLDGTDIFVLRSFCGEKERYPWGGLFKEGTVYSKKEIGEKAYVRGSVCGCAFRRSYLNAHSLHFLKGISLAEDTVFFASALSAGGSVQFHDLHLYQVQDRPGSASRRWSEEALPRYGASIRAAKETIEDPILRTRTCYSAMLGLIAVGIHLGIGPKRLLELSGTEAVLPLEETGIRKGCLSLGLLNRSFSLMYRLKALKEWL